MNHEDAISFATMLARAVASIEYIGKSKIRVHRMPNNLLDEPCVLVEWCDILRCCTKKDIEAVIQSAFRLGIEAASNTEE